MKSMPKINDNTCNCFFMKVLDIAYKYLQNHLPVNSKPGEIMVSNGSCHRNMCLQAYVDSKCPDQHVQVPLGPLTQSVTCWYLMILCFFPPKSINIVLISR